MMRLLLIVLTALLLSGASNPGERAAVAWLKTNARPIATTDPERQDADLQAISAIAGQARIAGFGEATHGSREFFRMKDRAFRHLVAQAGFNSFAIEANFADAERIDAWVKGGPGDPEALIAALGFWTWDTEEVLALVRWMRGWNADHGDTLSFTGVDIQHCPPNLELALAYLERFDPGGEGPRPTFAAFMAAATDQRAGYKAMAEMNAEKARPLLRAAEALVARLNRNRARLEAVSGRDSFLRAKAGATAAAWYFLMEGPNDERLFRNLKSGYDIRDRAMADLAKIALERAGAKGRVFAWAHNAHIGNEWFEDGRMTMGFFLKRELGPDYVSVGFAFDHGDFQAFPPADSARPEFRPNLARMSVGPAPYDHSEAVLRRAKPQDWLADLRSLDFGTPAYRWFSTARPLRWTGANYSIELMAKHRTINLAAQYDAVIFIDQVSRARPLSNTIRKLGLTKDW